MRRPKGLSLTILVAWPALLSATLLGGCAAEEASSSGSSTPTSSQSNSSSAHSASADFTVEVLAYSGMENPTFSSTKEMRAAAATCLHRLMTDGVPAAEFPGDGGLGYAGAIFTPAPEQDGLSLAGMKHDSAFGKQGDKWTSVTCEELSALLTTELDEVAPGLSDELSPSSSS